MSAPPAFCIPVQREGLVTLPPTPLPLVLVIVIAIAIVIILITIVIIIIIIHNMSCLCWGQKRRPPLSLVVPSPPPRTLLELGGVAHIPTPIPPTVLHVIVRAVAVGERWMRVGVIRCWIF